MKNASFLLSVLLVVFFLNTGFNGRAQSTIWSEDFSSYVENTGVEGPGAVNIGDYPAGVTKWTLDVSSCTLSNADDYLKTHNYAKELEGRDLDGPAVWLSDTIDISSFAAVTFSLDASCDGNLSSSEYFDVYYEVDGGGFTRIPNWNGMGNDYHTLVDNFSNTTVSKSINSGSELIIKVVMKNNGTWDRHYLDNIIVKGNMAYVSSTTSQNSSNVARGKTNRHIIGVKISTTGSANPLSVTSFTINANGSSRPVSNNIENAKIFYTETDNSFDTTMQFGSVYATPTVSDFDITGSQQLEEGDNYFWITFDTKAGGTLGDTIDAECVSMVIDGETKNPSTTAPVGYRIIKAPLAGNYAIGASGDYTSFADAADDLNNLGIDSTTIFTVDSGTYNNQVLLYEIEGTSASDTIVFKSASGNRQDVVLQYSSVSSSNNYTVGIKGSNYISFCDMTIKATGPDYGRVIFMEKNVQHINLTGCNFIGCNVNTTGDDYIVIYTESGSSNFITNLLIQNDSIFDGSKGIYFGGGGYYNPRETGNVVKNNVIENYYHIGIDVLNQDEIIISNNRITGKDTASYSTGILATECSNAIEITRNWVFPGGTDYVQGIYLSDCKASDTTTGLVANNFIKLPDALEDAVGIKVKNSGYQDIYHNTVHAVTGLKSSRGSRTYTKAGMYVVDDWVDALFQGINILNNIFSGGLPCINVNQTAADNGYVSSNHNDLHTSGSSTGKWGGTDCPTLSDWQTTSGQDANSVAEDPQFVNDDTPSVANENLKESIPSVSEVPRDIGYMPRRTNTTPGAKKFCHTWVGFVDDDWNNPGNWKPNVVPSSNDDICIGMCIHNPKIPPGITVRDLGAEAQAAILCEGNDLTINGNAHLSEIVLENDNVITFGGSENTEFSPGSQYYNRIVIQKDSDSAGILCYSVDDTAFFIDCEVSKGTFTASQVVVSGDADFTGGTADINTLIFNGTQYTNFKSGDNTMYIVVVDKEGNAELIMQDTLSLEEIKEFRGIINANNNRITVSGNADFSGGSVINLGDFEMTGTGDVYFNPGNNTMPKTSFTGGGTYWLQSNLTVNGDFYSNGTLHQNGFDVIVKSYTDLSNCNLQHDNGKFTVEAAQNICFKTGQYSIFNHLEIKVTVGGTTVQFITPGITAPLVAMAIDIFSQYAPMRDNDPDTVIFDLNVDCSNDLTIGTSGGGSVIVQIMPDKNLSVDGNTIINNTGNLIVKSDSSGTGSFIPKGAITGDGSSNITVERFLTGGKWHTITAPVDNATVNSLYFNGNPDVWLKKYNESSDTWSYITALSTPMPYGKGFICWVDASYDTAVSFNGSVRTTDLTLNAATTPPLAFTDIDHGYNLVGNPFTAPIDWDTGSWDRTNLEGTIWVWQDGGAGDGSGTYLVRNLAGEGSLTDGIIPVGQGFFVRAASSDPALTIPEDARVHSDQQFYKSGNRETASHVVLQVNNNQNCDEVWIGFDKETTTGFDYGRDGNKLFSNSGTPQLYLVEQNMSLSIDLLPELINGEQQTVALALKTGVTGNYTISMTDKKGMSETDILLEDLKTGIIHDLQSNPAYSFAVTQGDDPNRFLVHFFYVATGVNNPDQQKNSNNISIYGYNGAVYIKSRKVTEFAPARVKMYDVYGRLLFNEVIQLESINRVSAPVSGGCLIVTVEKEGAMTTGKVIVQ